MMSPETTKQGGRVVALLRTKKKRGVENEFCGFLSYEYGSDR